MKRDWRFLLLIVAIGAMVGMAVALFVSQAHAQDSTMVLPRLSVQRFGASLGIDHRWRDASLDPREDWLARLGVSYKLGKTLAAVATLRQPFHPTGKVEYTAGLSLVIIRDGKLVAP